MSVRYTAEAIMDARPLRDVDRNGGNPHLVGVAAVAKVAQGAGVERWREKIEVRLDNRQVFFLFFGSALVACMLFVLGVMVGKRIESRGQADAPAMADPLAALDRARQPPPGVAAPDQPLTFQSTLVSGGVKARAKLKAAAAALHVPAVAGEPRPPAARSAPTASRPLVAQSAPVAPRSVAQDRTPQPPADPARAKGKFTLQPPADPAKAKGKFTLQLSTFVTSEEAEAFAQRYPGAFVVAGDVPGKGMAYRVRYGNYGSYKDAAAAKDGFEKQHNMIALVAAR
jgi:DedD protein